MPTDAWSGVGTHMAAPAETGAASDAAASSAAIAFAVVPLLPRPPILAMNATPLPTPCCFVAPYRLRVKNPPRFENLYITRRNVVFFAALLWLRQERLR